MKKTRTYVTIKAEMYANREKHTSDIKHKRGRVARSGIKAQGQHPAKAAQRCAGPGWHHTLNDGAPTLPVAHSPTKSIRFS